MQARGSADTDRDSRASQEHMAPSTLAHAVVRESAVPQAHANWRCYEASKPRSPAAAVPCYAHLATMSGFSPIVHTKKMRSFWCDTYKAEAWIKLTCSLESGACAPGGMRVRTVQYLQAYCCLAKRKNRRCGP